MERRGKEGEKAQKTRDKPEWEQPGFVLPHPEPHTHMEERRSRTTRWKPFKCSMMENDSGCLDRLREVEVEVEAAAT